MYSLLTMTKGQKEMTKSAVRVVICPECKAEFPVPKGFAHTVLMKHMKEHMKQHKDVR